MARALLKKSRKITDSYAARKSQNELYYQMASVFKQAVKREDKQTAKILNRLLAATDLNVSLEKSV
jgi:hypothetical protein